MPESPYEVLGVKPEMPFPEIQKAYRTLVLKSHPKTSSTIEEKHQAEAKFLKITEAYKKLVSLNDEKLKGAKEAEKSKAAKTGNAAPATQASPNLLDQILSQQVELTKALSKQIAGEPELKKADTEVKREKKVEAKLSEQPRSPIEEEDARSPVGRQRSKRARGQSTSSVSSRDHPKAGKGRRQPRNQPLRQQKYETSSEGTDEDACERCGKDLKGRGQKGSSRRQNKDRRDSTSSVSSRDRDAGDRKRRYSTSSVSSKDRGSADRRQNRERRDSTSSVSSRDRDAHRGRRDSSSVSSRDRQSTRQRGRKTQNTRRQRGRRDSTSSVSSQERQGRRNNTSHRQRGRQEGQNPEGRQHSTRGDRQQRDDRRYRSQKGLRDIEEEVVEAEVGGRRRSPYGSPNADRESSSGSSSGSYESQYSDDLPSEYTLETSSGTSGDSASYVSEQSVSAESNSTDSPYDSDGQDADRDRYGRRHRND